MSGAGTATIESDTVRPGAEIDPAAFREALGLVQEGMLKVVRFQLAMERRDRRVAMAAIDDVVHLERRIAGLVASGDGDRDRHLAAQRAALAQEKFTLAAGMSTAVPRAAEPLHTNSQPPEAAIMSELADSDVAEPPVISWAVPAPAPARERGAALARLACALAAMLVVAAALTLAMLDAGTLDRWRPANWTTGGPS